MEMDSKKTMHESVAYIRKKKRDVTIIFIVILFFSVAFSLWTIFGHISFFVKTIGYTDIDGALYVTTAGIGKKYVDKGTKIYIFDKEYTVDFCNDIDYEKKENDDGMINNEKEIVQVGLIHSPFSIGTYCSVKIKIDKVHPISFIIEREKKK